MTIGDKSTRIVIKPRTETPDGQGGKIASYTTTRCTVWAYERPLTGRESLIAGQVTAVLSSVFEIWFRSDISVKDRIVVGTRTIQIESFYDPDARGRELYLVCSEVQA
jgi:SPP1 family predicted phage head-tail adaptor